MHRAWINTNLLTEYLNNAIIFVAFCFSVLPQSQLIIDILIVYLIYSGMNCGSTTEKSESSVWSPLDNQEYFNHAPIVPVV